jgi:hypothetical protein
MPPSKKKRGKAARRQPTAEELGQQVILRAATDGDGAAVARLLAAGADPNASVAARTPALLAEGESVILKVPISTERAQRYIRS